MGRLWCQKDPLFMVDGKPLHITIQLPTDVKDKVRTTLITFRGPNLGTFLINHGQARKELFGAPFDFYIAQGSSAIGIYVATWKSLHAPLRVSVKDGSNLFGDLLGVGETDKDLWLEDELVETDDGH